MLQNEFPTVPDRDEDSGDPSDPESTTPRNCEPESNTLIGVLPRTDQKLAQ